MKDETQQNLKLQAAYDAAIEGWLRAIELRSKEAAGQSMR